MRVPLLVLALSLSICSCKKNGDNAASDPCLQITVLQTTISEPLQAVFFLNGKDGFVSGYNGGIYKTVDSANTWTSLNSAVNLPIRGLFFLSMKKGFAVGGQNSCSGTGCVPPGGFILKTADGGNTWVKIYSSVDRIEVTSICFINTLNGFCAGDNVILKTTDGGQSWSEQRIENLDGKMMQVKFVNRQKGYVACLFDKIIKTDDGGETWQVTSPRRNMGYYSVSEANGSTYLSGQGKIIKSTDGGNSWIDLPNSPADIFAIHFINDKRGFAFGRGNYSGGDFGHA